MRRVALAIAVSIGAVSGSSAGDLPPPIWPAPGAYLLTPPPYDWTGLYVGGNLGLGWSWGNFSDPLGNTLSLPNAAQLLGGGQVGINYAFNSGFLIGAEADFQSLSNSNNTSGLTGLTTGSTATLAVNNRWLTTVTGRFGYAWDRLLVYGKGGGAWVGSNNPTLTINGAPVSLSTSNNNWGWTAGLGAEWAFWGSWSGRVEFDYVGLNGPNFTIPASVGGLPTGDQFSVSSRYIQAVNVGVNYKFGGWW